MTDKYTCANCNKEFDNEEDTKNCCTKKAKTHGDPCVELG